MEGKLIKLQLTEGYRLNDNQGNYIGSTLPDSKNKLSPKNCESIERGYDLDELFDEYYHYLSDTLLFTDDELRYAKQDFKAGFQKAVELMEKEIKHLREFARDCAENWDCDTDGHKYNTGCRCCEAELLKQQTEWDVEIVTDSIPCDRAPNGWDTFPKLDQNGCLILKRK